jgi:hypothetical protein
MADVGQVLATGGTALVSAAAGAGLTYWLGALNRRHQEAREDATRWYEERLRAYIGLPRAISSSLATSFAADISHEQFVGPLVELMGAVAAIRLVGSEETVKHANRLYDAVLGEVSNSLAERRKPKLDAVNSILMDFQVAARNDLGHIEAPTSQGQTEHPGHRTTEKAEGKAETSQPE